MVQIAGSLIATFNMIEPEPVWSTGVLLFLLKITCFSTAMCSIASCPTNRVVAKDKTAATSTRIELLNQIKAQQDLTMTDFKEADRDIQKRTSEFL